MTKWQDRIIKLDRKPASQFQAHPNNWRKHPMKQRSAVKGSLDSLGWVDVVIENVQTGHVIDGHERIWNALKKEDAEVPYILVDLSPEEEAQALLSLDSIAALATTDAEKVEELLNQVNTDNEDMLEFLVDFADDCGIDWGQEEPQDAEPQIDRAEELLEKWGVELGDLWRIGSHRLICGDCTDAAVVERLMDGEKATLIFTDPPYSFETDGGWFNGKRPKVMDRVKENKTNIFDPHLFLDASLAVFDNNYYSMFVFCNKALIHHYLNFAVDNKYSYNLLVWKKTNVIPFGDSHFPDVEYIVFIRKSAKWNNGTDANRSKVLVYDQDFENQKGHPTPKPEELIRNQLILTTDKGDVVVDFFLGGGTTLVACENLNRRGRGIEISPAYCAVVLERMATAFPELVIERVNNKDEYEQGS